jgi:hypothetical protein
MGQPFNESNHRYTSPPFVAELDAAVKFFKDTPVCKLPFSGAEGDDVLEPFSGAGVYAFYYKGNLGIYSLHAEANKENYNVPIYVGSALPEGWRKARSTQGNVNTLYNRLRQHAKSIALTAGSNYPLNPNDFSCRFMILKDPESKMITTVESQLIFEYRPLWNSYVDGFGNHDVGAPRATGRMTSWDTLHSGRYRRGTPIEGRLEKVLRAVEEGLKNLRSP